MELTWSGSAISVYGPGGELLVEYKNEAINQENTTTYHIQMGGQTVARRVIGSAASGSPIDRIESLHRNHLNQVVAVDGFGQVATYSRPFNSGGADQFQGHKDDPETGLHYNLARSYSPVMARWISADRVMNHRYNPESLNKYAFTRGDPTNFFDPDGRNLAYFQTLGSCPGVMAVMAWIDAGEDSYGVFLGWFECEGGGGGGGGGIDTQGGTNRNFIRVNNPSKTGANQSRIRAVMGWIRQNIDPICQQWLSGVNEAIIDLLGDESNEQTVLIGHGEFDTRSVGAFTGNDPSQTNVPAGYAMVVNDLGGFFVGLYNEGGTTRSITVNGFTGGTGQAQVAILLHELAHFLNATGFQSDFQNPNAGRANDQLVRQNCEATLHVARNLK